MFNIRRVVAVNNITISVLILLFFISVYLIIQLVQFNNYQYISSREIPDGCGPG